MPPVRREALAGSVCSDRSRPSRSAVMLAADDGEVPGGTPLTNAPRRPSPKCSKRAKRLEVAIEATYGWSSSQLAGLAVPRVERRDDLEHDDVWHRGHSVQAGVTISGGSVELPSKRLWNGRLLHTQGHADGCGLPA